MKTEQLFLRLFAILSFLFWSAKEATAQTNATSSLVGRFDGRTPCQEIAHLINHEVSQDCFKSKWSISLYQDPVTKIPTTYVIASTFHRKKAREGTWSIGKGTTANPNAIVYQLDTDNPQETIYLMKADENILYFLDKDKNLLVGNQLSSYTLNRHINP